jgi:hypothetical protein
MGESRFHQSASTTWHQMISITNKFAALLHSHIVPGYSSDGPLLLFMMCNHIHWKHLVFVESNKNKIRLSTITEFRDEVQTYLHFLQSICG